MDEIVSGTYRPILCLDFDGVLHAYTSGWQGIDKISDGPVEGAMQFLRDAVVDFDVHIFSSRSRKKSGREAMEAAIATWLCTEFGSPTWVNVLRRLQFPKTKPAAFVSIDDRAITFTGSFPDPASLLAFRPWNKSDPLP